MYNTEGNQDYMGHEGTLKVQAQFKEQGIVLAFHEAVQVKQEVAKSKDDPCQVTVRCKVYMVTKNLDIV
ncbi:MAG: hypothetical protein FWC79_06580 [Oscillospiraceae bacterium]|nr:hypothetical protein [Oscillospiraceae bacterium]